MQKRTVLSRAAGRSIWARGCLAIYDMSPLILAPGQAVDATWSWDVAGAYRLRVFLGDGPNAAATSSVIGPMFVVR